MKEALKPNILTKIHSSITQILLFVGRIFPKNKSLPPDVALKVCRTTDEISPRGWK